MAAALRLLLSTNRQAPLSSIASRTLSTTIISIGRPLSTTSTFYGAPSPPSTRYTINDSPSTDNKKQQQYNIIPPLSPLQRLGTLLHSSLTALNDPTRADAVAAVGEVTGSYALSKILVAMEKDENGRRILVERPVVDDRVAKRAAELLEQHNTSLK